MTRAAALADTQSVTLDCGHVVTYRLPQGQQEVPFHLALGHPWACVPCWNFGGFEGIRYAVLVDGVPIPQVPEFTPAPQAPAEPVKVAPGTVVRYHGSITNAHGEYLYAGLCGCFDTDECEDGCIDDYPNRHQLQDPHSPGAMLHARRSSFTPVKVSAALAA